MLLRRFTSSDMEAIENIYKKAGYVFDMPNFDRTISSWVAESDGQVIGYACIEPKYEVTLLLEPKAGSPHRKLGIIKELHKPLARDARDAGIKEVFVNLDPSHPRFGEHLKRFGWKYGWRQMRLLISSILGRS